MIRRSAWLFVLCLILSGLSVQALCQDTVKLEYKFTPGELLRYKMVMDMNMTMQSNMFGGEQMPTIPAQMTMIMRQRTRRVLPNGDAELAVAIESMSMNAAGSSQKIPARRMPTMTMVMSKNGVLKSVKGLEGIVDQFNGSEFANLGSLGQYGAAFPSTELKVGDVWAENVPFAMGGGSLRTEGKLLSANVKLGKHTVAKLKQDVGGDINFTMPIPMPAGSTSGSAPVMDMKGVLIGDAVIYFSPDKGRMIRTEGKMDMQATVNVSGAPNGQSGAIDMDMQMNFQMFLLPGK